MPKRVRLGLKEPEFTLADGQRRVWLASRSTEPEALSDASDLVVRGSGYASEGEAALDGERWRDIVSRAFSRLHLAADFGDRKASGTLRFAGESMYAGTLGHPVLSDQPGVTVFVDEPSPIFIALRFGTCRSPSEHQTREVLTQAARYSDPLDGNERVAFDLYSASFFQASADSRLLMLTMAIETLLVLRPRSQAAQAHVADLIAATDASPNLTHAERDSLKGSLAWLLSESIGQAGRRLVRDLGPRMYGQMTPSRLFTRCFEMRSALAHGRIPRPGHGEVDRLASSLEVLVGDLLAGRLLDEVSG